MCCFCSISLSASGLLLDSLPSSLLNIFGTFPIALQECHNCRKNINLSPPVIIFSAAGITNLAQVQSNIRLNKILTSRLGEKQQHGVFENISFLNCGAVYLPTTCPLIPCLDTAHLCRSPSTWLPHKPPVPSSHGQS